MSFIGRLDQFVMVQQTVTGVDMKVVANTDLYQTPAGKIFIPSFVVIRPTTVNIYIADATVSLKTNGGQTIIGSTVTTALNSNSKIFTLWNTGVSVFVAATVITQLSVDAGANATDFIADVDVGGYLR